MTFTSFVEVVASCDLYVVRLLNIVDTLRRQFNKTSDSVAQISVWNYHDRARLVQNVCTFENILLPLNKFSG